MTTTKKTEAQQCESHVHDIERLQDWLSLEVNRLNTSTEHPDWTHVGSLAYIRNKLMEMLASVSGNSVEIILNTLEEQE